MQRLGFAILVAGLVSVPTLNLQALPDQATLIRDGVGLYDSGDYGAALVAFRAVLSADPDQVVAWYELGLTHAALGENDACLEAAREGLDREPTGSVEALLYTLAGNCTSGTGRPKKAIRWYERGLKRHPEDVGLHFNIAIPLSTLGRQDEAVSHLERAIAANPRYASAQLLLGQILAGKGQRSLSLFSFLRSFSLETGSERAAATASAVMDIFDRAAEETEPGQVNVSVPVLDEDDPYATIEMAISLAAASMYLDDSRAKSPARRYVEALVTSLQITAELESWDGEPTPIWTHTVRPLLDLQRAGHLETLAWLLAARAGMEGAEEWLRENGERIDALTGALDR